ncbi:hypothetical protein SeJ_A1116 [Salmonella enterica subsp. enterica serovar Javiana str. GA_MM04042433]|nr:hypothetical protein SeJ_A1116 [Salmonella enterica subsp. enterica serovar Javiana str. GA_MM04042433]
MHGEFFVNFLFLQKSNFKLPVKRGLFGKAKHFVRFLLPRIP